MDTRVSAIVENKLEIVSGRLFWDDETRLAILGMLLENCGADAAVRLGNPDVWREAVAHLRSEDSDGGDPDPPT